MGAEGGSMEARWWYRGRLVMDEVLPDEEKPKVGVPSLQWLARRALLKSVSVPEAVKFPESCYKPFVHEEHVDYELHLRNVYYVYWLSELGKDTVALKGVLQVPLQQLSREDWSFFQEVVVLMEEPVVSLEQEVERLTLEEVVKDDKFAGPPMLTVIYSNYVVGDEPKLKGYRLKWFGFNQLSFERRLQSEQQPEQAEQQAEPAAERK